MLTIKGPQGRINRAVWGPLNNTIISAGEDAMVRIWDSEVSGCIITGCIDIFTDIVYFDALIFTLCWLYENFFG